MYKVTLTSSRTDVDDIVWMKKGTALQVTLCVSQILEHQTEDAKWQGPAEARFDGSILIEQVGE